MLIETHGVPDGFTIGGEYNLGRFGEEDNINNAEEYKEFLKNEVGDELYQAIISNEVRLNYYVKTNPSDPRWWEKEIENKLAVPTIKITSKRVKNLNLDLSGTIVVGNMCYSGYTDPTKRYKRDQGPIQPAFMSLNPISYYSYINRDDDKSQIVKNTFAIACEDSLLQSLLYDLDTTGLANLWNGTDIPTDETAPKGPLQFKLSGDDGFRYGCGTFVDARDNQEYKMACIGDQVWMAENLNFAGAGIYFDNRPIQCDNYGRHYTKQEATGGVDRIDRQYLWI